MYSEETDTQVRYLDRRFVRNVFRHTDVHNRMQEQEEMWRARDIERNESKSECPHSPERNESKRKRPRSSINSRRKSRKETEANDDYHRHANNLRRELIKSNPLNSDRWTHNGFLELYPEEMISKLSMDEESEEEGRRKKKKTKHKRVKKKRSKKKHQQRESSDSSEPDTTSSESSESSEEEKAKKYKRTTKSRKKKRKKKKHKKER